MCVPRQGQAGRKWGINDWRVRLRPPEYFCRRMLGSNPDRQGHELPQILPISFSFPFLARVTPVLKDIPPFLCSKASKPSDEVTAGDLNSCLSSLRLPSLEFFNSLLATSLPLSSFSFLLPDSLQYLVLETCFPLFNLSALPLGPECFQQNSPPPYCSSVSAGTSTHCGIPNSVEGLYNWEPSSETTGDLEVCFPIPCDSHPQFSFTGLDFTSTLYDPNLQATVPLGFFFFFFLADGLRGLTFLFLDSPQGGFACSGFYFWFFSFVFFCPYVLSFLFCNIVSLHLYSSFFFHCLMLIFYFFWASFM